MYYMLIVC